MVVNTSVLSWYFLMFAALCNEVFVTYHFLQRFLLRRGGESFQGSARPGPSEKLQHLTLLILARDEGRVDENTVRTLSHTMDEGFKGVTTDILRIDAAKYA